MISRRPPGTAAVPPDMHEDRPGWETSLALWREQQAFDGRLHRDRGLVFPRDVEGDARRESRREWVLGECFALLEELAELLDAKEAGNPDEETVDTLHFVLSLAERLGMTPWALGRFEDRFDAAAAAAGDAPWEEVLAGVLPDYVRALSDLKGTHFKWWKDTPRGDWADQWEALRRIDHLNLMVASRVFPSARAMSDRYMGKVAENHARQRGEVPGRESYAV